MTPTVIRNIELGKEKVIAVGELKRERELEFPIATVRELEFPSITTVRELEFPPITITRELERERVTTTIKLELLIITIIRELRVLLERRELFLIIA